MTLREKNIKKELRRNPIDILMREHEEGLRRLNELERAADSIKSEGFSAEAFEQIAETIRWMNTEVRRHTQFEERFMFPLVERHMRSLAEQVRGEHRELWDSFSELLNTVKEVEEGRLHGTSILDVVRTAKTIVELMRNHIRRENTILYPAVRQLITENESKNLLDRLLRER